MKLSHQDVIVHPVQAQQNSGVVLQLNEVQIIVIFEAIQQIHDNSYAVYPIYQLQGRLPVMQSAPL